MESVSWGFVNEVTNIESFFGLGKETCHDGSRAKLDSERLPHNTAKTDL